MNSKLLRLIPIIAFSLTSLHAAEDPHLARLRAADDERVAAVVRGDRPQLSAILSDDLRYVHSTGAVDTKTSFIELVGTGRTKYLGWNYAERNFTFPAPGIALMMGRTHLKLGKAEGTSETDLSFLAVWRMENGRWRFLAWQSCKLPDPAPATK